MSVFKNASAESHLHGRCQEVQAAISDAVALEDVPERHFSHAEHCAVCGPFLDQYRAFALVTIRARRAQDRARDLSPQSWVRIRQGVDQAKSERRIRSIAMLGLAAASAVAAVFLLLPRLQGIETIQARALAEGTMQAQHHLDVAAPRLTPALRAQLVGGRDVVIADGDTLEGGSMGKTYRAFGRHTIILEPGSVVRATSWEDNRMALAVLQGVAAFEVNRATLEESFQVWSGDVQVHVKGTVFAVERKLSGATRVTVDHGRVVVSRVGNDDVPVQAGERVTFPPTVGGPDEPELPDLGLPTTNPTKIAQPTPRPEKVVDIDIDLGGATGVPSGPTLDVPKLMPAILTTVRAGRCTQALNALAELDKTLGAEMPREAIWMSAYCKRKLGDIPGSAALFNRYGSQGPWQVPEGTENPPLP